MGFRICVGQGNRLDKWHDYPRRSLQNGYRSTWPSYSTGNGFAPSLGGPATVYALDPSWDTTVEYRGLTISGTVQTYAPGRSIKFTDVTFNGCATSGGLAPTHALSVLLTNVTTLCQMEVDKLVTNFDIEGGTFGQLLFQSSSGATRFNRQNTERHATTGCSREQRHWDFYSRYTALWTHKQHSMQRLQHQII